MAFAEQKAHAMGRQSQPSQPPPPAPALRVPRAEAAAKIQAQINEGEALFAQQPRSGPELDRLREQWRIWSDYNRELLVQLFTSPVVADEYSAFVGGAFSMSPTFAELVGYWRDDVQSSLTRLRSIYRRLELFPAPEGEAPAPRQRTTRGTGVFLVHGSNDAAKSTVARFLERLNLNLTILHEQPDKGRTVIEKFEDNASVGYAVILLTADDVGAIRASPTDLQPRARQNVLLELGYFLGTLGRTHVCALREEGVEIPSDLAGVLYVPFDAAGAWKLRLAMEIKAAGIDLDLNRVM
jgi:predicted nucleotide-binding protein